MAYVGMKLVQEEEMLVEYGFSVSSGNTTESSSGSEVNSQTMIAKTLKRKNLGVSNKTRVKNKMNKQTSTVKTTTLTDDGYGWRKYGQKPIHNHHHPKSYYRCTHSKEEKCQAKKWIQQESNNPPVYKTTYIGHHTCKNPLKIPQIFYPDYPPASSPSSYDSTIQSFNHNYHFLTSQHPILLSFESPTSVNHISNLNMEHMNGQMEQVATPQSISTVDSMMFANGLENEACEIENNCYFPSISSPNCDFESYDIDMMLQEFLGLDHVN